MTVPAQGGPAAHWVKSLIRDRISNGDLAPGDRIIERRLCSELDISRTPLREALKLLEIDGLIELTQHRGARVKPYAAAEAVELFDVLASLDGLAARRAGERIDEAELAELHALHARAVESGRGGASRTHDTLALDFERAILDLAANSVLSQTRANISDRALRGHGATLRDAEMITAGAHYRQRLLEALADGDPDEAARAWSEFTLERGAEILKALRSANGSADSSTTR